MAQDSISHEAIVSTDGQTYIAPFFVEAGIIHARIEDTVVQLPLSDQPPEQSVAEFILEHVREQRSQER